MPTGSDDLLNGRYKVQKELGAGGMGAVYLAFDTLYQELCAVKRFGLEDLPTEEETHLREGEEATRARKSHKTPPLTREKAVGMFRSEAQLLAKLVHPNLPRVTDFFYDQDSYYLVMTLIEGETLADTLEKRQNGPLTEAKVMGWMHQVMDALEYCHAEGVIHRDIKPENMIRTAADEVFLVDFGIAVTDVDSKTRIAAYTPGYSPLEQRGDQGTTDERTDIYALGATMYRLLTAQELMDASARLNAETDMPPPHQVVKSVSPGVSAAVMKAMSLMPRDRFGSIGEMRAALSQPETKTRISPWLWIPLAVLAAVLLIAGAVWLIENVIIGSATPTAVAVAATTMVPATTAVDATPTLPVEEAPSAEATPLPAPSRTSIPATKVAPTEAPPTPTLEPTAGVTDTAAPTSTPAPTQAPANTSTPTPMPTETAKSTPTPPEPTPRPTRQPTQAPTATPRPQNRTDKYLAPILSSPAENRVFSDKDVITLSWQSVGQLAPDEFYVPSLAYLHSGEMWWDDTPWLKDTSWNANEHRYLLDMSDNGEFLWSVRVMQKTSDVPKPTGVPVSPASASRTFTWKFSSPPSNQKEPPPP